jgi:hypothetical protein
MSSFGERLKYFRKNILKLKRTEFCERYSLPVVTVQTWENNGIQISRLQVENLERKLKNDNSPVNFDWLFKGEGEIWDHYNNTVNHSTEKNKVSCDLLYKIETYFYEPLLKKNAEVSLVKINLKDIDCPAFGALRDGQHHMHFGIINLTFNKLYVMEAYQGNFYKIVLSEDDDIYLIKNVSLFD